MTKKKSEKKAISLAEEISSYYGFNHTNIRDITDEDKKTAAFLGEETLLGITKRFPLSSVVNKISLLNYFERNKLENESLPALLSFEGKSNDHSRKSWIDLEIMGTGKAIAEAIIIKTIIETLKQIGFENLYVDMNSLGDKESTSKFVREVTQFYRKKINNLSPACRQNGKEDVLNFLECKGGEKCKNNHIDAPESISFLSEQSRLHFAEVLEFMEALKIPYRINHSLIANRNSACHTIFSIKTLDTEDSLPLAFGFRYNILSKKMGWRRELQAIGGSSVSSKSESIPSGKRMPIPKIYFMQIGTEAKLKSLQIIDLLRENKIPVYQSLAKDKMTSQLYSASALKIPYTIIFGQKEAMEGSVIVRNMESRSQENVSLKNLPAYLKRKIK